MQAQVLSVQMLQLPALLNTLTEDQDTHVGQPMLLASGKGQAATGHVFKGWQDTAQQQTYKSAITAGHGPALLGYAAGVSLLQTLPDASGQPATGHHLCCPMLQTCWSHALNPSSCSKCTLSAACVS